MLDSPFYKRFFHVSLLALAISLCYSGSLDNSFHFDDYRSIVYQENVHPVNLSWKEVSKSFYSSLNKGKLSRPIANLTFALNYYVSGLDTRSYHLVNIIIHIFSSIFIYLLFYRTLLLYGKQKTDTFTSPFSKVDIALLGAMLWALHPIQTQAITYIVQRMASMASLMYLAAMYCYVQFRLSRSWKSGGFLLALSIVFWLAGIFTKENAVMLPLALLGYEIVFFQIDIRKYKKTVIGTTFLLVSVGLVSFILLRGEVIDYLSLVYDLRPFNMWQRLLTEPIILIRYLFLLLLPLSDFLGLEADIFASQDILNPWQTLPANMFVIALILFSVVCLRKIPLLCFALYFYFVNHVIESSFIGLELYFEHRNYLPSIFIYLVLSYYLTQALAYYQNRGKVFIHALFVLAITVVLVSTGNATYMRNEIWKDEMTLWTDTVKKAPRSLRALVALEAEYYEKGMTDKAHDLLIEAERLYKENPERYQEDWVEKMYFNAGLLYARKKTEKDRKKAIQLFYKASQMDTISSSYKTHVNLGILLFEEGDSRNAAISLVNALAMESGIPEIYNIYGRILFDLGEVDLAVKSFKKGVLLGGSSKIRLNLVAAYVRLKNFELAQQELKFVPDESRDLSYYLLHALAYSGDKRHRSLKEVAQLLYANDDYCSWIRDVKTARDSELIYPDISVIEKELKQQYMDTLIRAAQSLETKRQRAVSYSLRLSDD